ncbi:uncharacterized protein MKK02DRAFT_28838 [Dioszegia hungarica]|uniref:Uncharacterized protein n=1 Tax=Dioszegia hungarica TaxID=4972 RepID=A0AA38H7A2_9TREE|nr:uncharacterized protein MKK02DRAFT_28838 [Dioszegia hungarica]KAI9634159.1 hypothetical protein MKK02DRAFT_28838 [Dioszegia hungarica]
MTASGDSPGRTATRASQRRARTGTVAQAIARWITHDTAQLVAMCSLRPLSGRREVGAEADMSQLCCTGLSGHTYVWVARAHVRHADSISTGRVLIERQNRQLESTSRAWAACQIKRAPRAPAKLTIRTARLGFRPRSAQAPTRTSLCICLNAPHTRDTESSPHHSPSIRQLCRTESFRSTHCTATPAAADDLPRCASSAADAPDLGSTIASTISANI